MKNMLTLGTTYSACEGCRKLVPAKIFSDGSDVFFQKFCNIHGEQTALVRANLDDYIKTLRYVKPAWTPRQFSGDANAACPDGCGYCTRHEQHLCLPIIEITSRCDLACPICIADAGGQWDMTTAELEHILNTLITAEGQINVVNFSGGEPLLHPHISDFIDIVLNRPELVRLTISTNGLSLLKNPQLVEAIKKRNVCIALQFDGFTQRPYEVLRGRHLLNEKLEILELLRSAGITTVLTMTAAHGVNDDQFASILSYLFNNEHTVSLMVQPLAFAGRAASLSEQLQRLTIPDVIELLANAGNPCVSADDFLPLPCSHPLCFELAFYLMTKPGEGVSVNSIASVDEILDSVANRVFFGLDPYEHEQLKRMVYELWSGSSAMAPDSEAVLNALRDILRSLSRSCSCSRDMFTIAERKVKSIFIHAFQDAKDFDLARVRRCCNAYPQADGRLLSPCVRNVAPKGK